VTTRLAPSVLLGYLHAIEARGRRRAVSAGATARSTSTSSPTATCAATIPALLLPHPRAAERDFVLEPWLVGRPDAVLPGAGRVADLLAHCARDGAASAEAAGAAREARR
jgi:2-amino-4-hydroxy-6-hydroxymethyldihydropteridine diphosphokinase